MDENGQQQVWMSFFTPTSFTDAPPIVLIPEKVPEEISKTITSCFHLFWSDPSSCLNKIRICIEEILTFEKIPRFSNKNGKRNKIPLHGRITEYEKKNKQVADLLMALKWLGNDGSHLGNKTKTIEKSNLLEAFSILEVCLELIFDNKAKLVAATAKKINKKRGV